MTRAALQVLTLAEGGPVAADELGRRNVRRDVVEGLVEQGAVVVDPDSGEVELTAHGRRVLQQRITTAARGQDERLPGPLVGTGTTADE